MGQGSGLMAERAQRGNRGRRMRELVGEEAEADEDFWGQDFFAEESEDDVFGSTDEEQEREDFGGDGASDSFDSDFDDSESESDGAPADEPREERRRKKAKPPGPPKPKKKRKKGPGRPPGPTKPHPPASRKSSRASMVDAAARLEATMAVQERERQARERKAAARAAKAGARPRLTQYDLLAEAARTELDNALSLQRLLAREEESKRRAARGRGGPAGPIVRLRSRRDERGEERTSLAFLQGAFIPRSMRERPAAPAKPVCAVTGLPAKYRDPLTGKPYATKEAFRALRAQHARGQGEARTPRLKVTIKSPRPGAGGRPPAAAGSPEDLATQLGL